MIKLIKLLLSVRSPYCTYSVHILYVHSCPSVDVFTLFEKNCLYCNSVGTRTRLERSLNFIFILFYKINISILILFSSSGVRSHGISEKKSTKNGKCWQSKEKILRKMKIVIYMFSINFQFSKFQMIFIKNNNCDNEN